MLCSSFDGECVAMIQALKWIEEQPQTEGIKYAIYTDSRSIVSALEAKDWKDRHEWMKEIKTTLEGIRQELVICWVPSHCNTYGNEKADKLADEGS